MLQSIRVSSRGTPTVLVLGHQKGKGLDKSSAARDTEGWIAAAAQRAEATGEVGSIAEVTDVEGFERVILLGLGDGATMTSAGLRKAAGLLARRLAAIKAETVELDLAGALGGPLTDEALAGCAFGEGMGLAGWSCETFRGTGSTAKTMPKLVVQTPSTGFASGLERGLGLAESANICRTMSQTPPNVATPAWIANEAKKMARQTGLKCTVISGKQLEDERLTGMVTVGAASENLPCMIRLEYTPSGRGRGSKSTKPIVLLGKTITYDTGGLSLKVNNGMKGMKRDKDGGCAVFGAMHAIATVIKPRVPVVGLLVAAENSISDEAYRPDDVLTFRNGVTVEVTNTDAEGRLVLADGLCWACDKENPAAIIDLATLTGGVVVALGSTFAGMWCEDEALRGRLEQASCASGERLWRLPHHAEYREMMKSPIADITNSAPVREAHPIQGAAFLSYFCKEGIPWAHIDIAGTHATDRDLPPFVSGPTGFGTRLLAELLDQY